MARLSMNVVATVLVIAALVGCDAKDVSKRQAISLQFPTINTNDILRWICEDNPYAHQIDFCQSMTTTPTTTKAPVSGSTGTTRVPEVTTTTTESPSVLERAYWCRLSNGSYLSRGYSFMHTDCKLCQCTQSRAVRCVELQCMPTYCIDNTTPTRKAGQCCGQCAYETNSTQCVQNGIAFPHGTIVKATSDRVYCWCQLGTIECRKIGISLFSGMDLWGEGTAVYVIVIIICVLLIVGTLLCGGCSLLYYYYYYYYNQQPTEQNFWENAGWQPMGEEEQVVDGEAAKKQAEAEQSKQGEEYPAGYTPEFVPPPYALYNGGYENEQGSKDQKYV